MKKLTQNTMPVEGRIQEFHDDNDRPMLLAFGTLWTKRAEILQQWGIPLSNAELRHVQEVMGALECYLSRASVACNR